MNTLLHSRFAEIFGWMLLHSLWQLTLIAVLSATALAALRRASANARYLLASLGLVLMLLLPILTYVRLLPSVSPSLSPPLAPTPIVVTYATASGNPASNAQPLALPPTAPLPLTVRLQSILTPCLPWAVTCYFLGMAAMLLRLLTAYACLRRVISQGAVLQGHVAALAIHLARKMHAHRTIRLLQSAAIEVPTLLGTFKPVILLPATALTGLSPDQLAALLAHEIAHIRRHDYLANLVQSVIETLLFYHPAAWWLSSRIRHERELCCDDAAIAATADRLAYARALATMESLRVPANVALAAAGGPLLTRIRRILTTTSAAPQPGRLFASCAAALILALIVTAAYIGCAQSTSSNPATSSVPSSLANQNTPGLATLTFDIRYLVNPSLNASDSDKHRSVQEIVDAIQSTVAPETWQANGGTLGSIQENDGRLTISQTPVHLDAVNDLLEQLFQTRAAGVYLDCRALLVSNNFLDDFRVGWSAGIPFEGDSSTPPPNNASFLDNWTSDLLLNAIKADRRSISTTACTQTPSGYPISLDILPPPDVAPRISGKDFAGIHLNITASASADRRYVTLAGLRPAKISTVPPAAAPATRRPPVITMLSTPDGGALLINGGPVDDADGKPTYHLLILIQPKLRLDGLQHALFKTAGGYVRDDPPALASAPPTTAPASRQVLVKAAIAELDADDFAKLASHNSTHASPSAGSTSQPTSQTAILENPDDFVKQAEKLFAQKPTQMLYSPNIMVQNGQEAVFVVGQQVPWVRGYYTDPVKGRSPAVDFRQVGIRFSVLPKFTDHGPIQLDIDTSLSTLATVQPPADPATGLPPIGTPLIDERKAKTTLQIENDKSAVLALQPAKPGKVTLVFITPHVNQTTTLPPTPVPASP